MLHKQRSNSKSQWKFTLILPILLAFIFTFNTKVIAQQNNDDKKIIKETVEIFALGIDKNTGKDALNDMAKKFSKKGLTIKFNGVKRNSNGEITAIKIDAKAKNGKVAASHASDNDDGIKPMQIAFDKDNNSISIGSIASHGYSFSKKGHKKIIKHHGKGKGSNYIFFSDDNKNTRVTKKGGDKIIIEINEDEDHNGDGMHEIIIDENDDGKEVKKEIIKIKRSKGKKEDGNVFIYGNHDGNPLIFLNGKKIDKEQMKDIDGDLIESIEVFKGEKAIEKYGKEAKDGVIKITSKKQ